MTPSRPVLVFYSRIDAFGDALLRLPALRAARSAFPDHRVVYGASHRTMLQIALPQHVAGLVDAFRPDAPLEQIVGEEQASGGPVTVIDLRNLAPAMAKARMRLAGKGVTYLANLPGFLLSSDFGRPFETRPRHNAWRYHRMVERLAKRMLPFDHRLLPSAAARELARSMAADGRPVALVSGNAGPEKAMTDKQAAAIGSMLIAYGFNPIYLLTPGPGPTRAGLEAIEPRMAIVEHGPRIDRASVDDLTLALGEIAEAAISIHSGMIHFLSCVMTPLVVINNGFNMTRWRPLCGAAEIIEAGDFNPERRAADIPPDAIMAAFRRLVAAGRRDRPSV
ncbi:MAG: glycosyltransferase family 9 protein [Rhizobiaceae bacterium]